MKKQQLEKLKLAELREEAKRLDLKGTSSLRRSELIEEISDYYAKKADEEKSQPIEAENVNNEPPKEKNIRAEKNSEECTVPVVEYSDPVRRTN